MEYYLGVNRTINSTTYNNAILQKADKRTATRWRLVKNALGEYGLICAKNGGCLQINTASTSHGVPAFTGRNL